MMQKHIVCSYLEHVKHPKHKLVRRAKITMKKISWATQNNFTDCGVFLMRHMELYNGKTNSFECGFVSDEEKQKVQITNLRMRYATKLVLSPSNVFLDKVWLDAENTVKMMKESPEYVEFLNKSEDEYKKILAGLAEIAEDEEMDAVTREAEKKVELEKKGGKRVTFAQK
jgi:hypothetical protein